MVGRAAGYAAVNVKIRAMKAKLLGLSDYDRIIQADNLVEGIRTIIGLVMPSKLAEELAFLLSSGDKVAIVDFDKVLTQSFIAVHTKLVEMCPEDTQEFLGLYLKKYEFDNLKIIIKAIHQGLPPNQIRSLLLPSISGETEELLELIALGSIAQLKDAFQDELAKKAVLEAFEEYEATNSTLPLELAMDRVFYTQWWDTIAFLAKSDRKWAYNLIGTRIDLQNLLFALRGVQMGLDSSTLKKFIIPITYQLKKNLERVVESQTQLEAIRFFVVHTYEKIANSIREIIEENRSLVEIEHLTEEYLARENVRVFVSYPFHIGTVLAFLNLIQTEYKNLRTILIGKAEGVTSSKIRESLIFIK
ncbi:MAG: V-type ATPase subunit [Candidatus Heimdallarchaeota archaeon]